MHLNYPQLVQFRIHLSYHHKIILKIFILMRTGGTRKRQFAVSFFFKLDISKIRKGSTWTSVFHIKNEGRASSNVKSGFIFHSEVKKARPKGMKIAFFHTKPSLCFAAASSSKYLGTC